MKNYLLLACLFPAVLFAQNTYTVCNAVGIKANYRTLQGAIDSVSAGSTLYVFPSDNSYGGVTINKKLTILGTGFMLDQNVTPATTPNTNGAKLMYIHFLQGSDYSYIEGLQLNEVTGPGNPSTNYRFFLDSGVANITITRCWTSIWPDFRAGNTIIVARSTINCSINESFLYCFGYNTNHSSGNFFYEAGEGSQNLQISNNIIIGPDGCGMNYLLSSAYYGNLYFTNNTFFVNMSVSFFSNYTYVNNFFINSDTTYAVPASIGLNGNTCHNNITNAPNLFGTNSLNIQNVNPDSVFVYSIFGYHSFDEKWKVRSNNFAKTYASDGGEVGAYGGYDPYKLSGLSRLPYIYDLTVSKDSAVRGNIKIHIKAKANN